MRLLLKAQRSPLQDATRTLFRFADIHRTLRHSQKTRSEIIAAGAREDDVFEVVGDIADLTVQKALVDKTVSTFGKIDVLVCAILNDVTQVNNAGATAPDRSLIENFEAPLEHFDFVIDVNLKS